jgi:hypothetical protein
MIGGPMIDQHAATELKLYIDNDGDLYRSQTTSILKNLATKRARGQYKHDLAVKLFGYLVESGAKKYAKGYQPWHKMFDVATRKAVAEALTKDFEGEAKLGNYDNLLPKKYRSTSGGSNGSSHARKKISWKTPESIKVVWSPVNQAYFALWPGKGAIKDQQVLKVASAEAMHDWLRETYGDAYGLAGRAATRSHSTIHHAVTAKDLREFRGFLRNATNRQVQGIYDKETRAGRDEYAELAVAEAARRGIELEFVGGDDQAPDDDDETHGGDMCAICGGKIRGGTCRECGRRSTHSHASKKSRAQLDREIAGALGKRRHF